MGLWEVEFFVTRGFYVYLFCMPQREYTLQSLNAVVGLYVCHPNCDVICQITRLVNTIDGVVCLFPTECKWLHWQGIIACERALTNAYHFSRLLSFQVACMFSESGNVVKLALWLCYLLILCCLLFILMPLTLHCVWCWHLAALVKALWRTPFVCEFTCIIFQ